MINTILYFDIFNYPLTEEELFHHHGAEVNRSKFNLLLRALVDENLLKQCEQFYLAPFSDSSSIQKRKNGNRMAAAVMPTAVKWGRIIYSFPFVRSVNLSGSLSKNYYDVNSDIDFFIITKKNRLWICRTLLSIYWRFLSPVNKKNFCTNYFVDETVLEMGDKNQFTAIELSHLIPLINGEATERLLLSNKWVKSFVRNKVLVRQFESVSPKKPFKNFLEKMMENKMGDLVDNFLLKITIRHWRKKYPDLASEDFELQFRSRKNVCKRHTKGFQNKVLQKWHEKQEAFQKLFTYQLD